jgi:hypothetical protein
MSTPVEAATHTIVSVLYNGRVAAFHYRPHELVHALLKHALHEFGIVANHDEMALFNAAGDELPPGQSLADAGVHPGAELVLRQRVVRGGI